MHSHFHALSRRTLLAAMAAPIGVDGAQRQAGRSGIRQALRQRASAMTIFDTHEHLRRESERLEGPSDVFLLFSHYVNSDLVSAGMDRDAVAALQNSRIPLDVRWKSVAPYWSLVSSTGYGRCMRIAARDLYGIEEIDGKTYQTLSSRIAAASRTGLYKHVLKDKARIELAVLDDVSTMRGQPLRPEPEFYKLVTRFEYITLASKREDLDYVEKMTGVAVSSLAGLEQALETHFRGAVREGLAGVKMGLAYARTLEVGNVQRADAERAFDALFGAAGARTADEASTRRLQDYLIHCELRHASDLRLPVQIHTGLLAGNTNENLRTNPSLLGHLLRQYPQVRFDLFHGGYPYMSELAALAKNLPNVYPDLCWLHIISPEAAARLLGELIDTVPANKILGFGGDFRHVEGTYAHAQMARAITADVLAGKVERGDLTETEAMALLERILYRNGKELFAGTPNRG